MRRGDIVRAAGGGDFLGKPRPALIVQTNLFLDAHPSVTICPITSHVTGDFLYRVLLDKGEGIEGVGTGLLFESEIEVDKITTIWSRRIAGKIGAASDAVMFQVDIALRRWLQL